MINPSEIIRAKRDCKRLEKEQIAGFISGYLKGEVAEYQMSAFLMAVFLNGMDDFEAAILTDEYIKSGIKIDWSDLPGVPVDKHSTGGVGDKVSLILAPLVAACGGFVPMLSGRGLGHTGGTLDKLESIPGFTTRLSVERLKSQVKKIGCAMGGQTAELAPADGRIYSLRDVTATVESIPLICASIMSKKIAEGAKGLVLDVKTGSGAFMSTLEKAEELAKLLIAIGGYHGQNVRALLTDMSEPLGVAVGNALEVEECIKLMRGEIKIPKLREVTLALAGEMLVMSGIARTNSEGENIAAKKWDDGSALEKFREMISEQEGNPRVCYDVSILPHAKIKMEIPSLESGFAAFIDTRAIGIASVELGAGRKLSSDTIAPSVGFEVFSKIGDKIEIGEPLGIVHASNIGKAQTAISAFQKAYTFSANPIAKPITIVKRLP
jgi:pyrimidine-nucleoside phosphorylase